MSPSDTATRGAPPPCGVAPIENTGCCIRCAHWHQRVLRGHLASTHAALRPDRARPQSYFPSSLLSFLAPWEWSNSHCLQRHPPGDMQGQDCQLQQDTSRASMSFPKFQRIFLSAGRRIHFSRARPGNRIRTRGFSPVTRTRIFQPGPGHQAPPIPWTQIQCAVNVLVYRWQCQDVHG